MISQSIANRDPSPDLAEELEKARAEAAAALARVAELERERAEAASQQQAPPRSKLHRFFQQSGEERAAYVSQGMEIVSVLGLELDAAAEDEALPASRRLKLVMSKAAEFEAMRGSLDRKLQRARDTLMEEFEAKAQKLFDVFEEYRVPHDAAFDTIASHLALLLEGATLDIVAPSELQNPVYQRFLAQQEEAQRQHRASGGRTSSSSSSSSSARPVPAGTSAPSPANGRLPDLTLSRSRSHDGLGASKPKPGDDAAAAQAAAAAEAAERRRATAADLLVPLFPDLGVDLAVRYLELYGDSVERAMVALLEAGAGDPQAANKQLAANGTAPPAAPTPTPAAAAPLLPSSSSPRVGSAPGTAVATAEALAENARRALSRWLDSLPRLMVRVEGVLDGLDVEFRVLRDRNGCPVDQALAPVHTVAATELFYSLGCRILEPAEKEALHAALGSSEGVPVVTYRPNGSTFGLIDVRPRVPLSQYRMDYSPDTGTVTAVYHQDDGPILYTAYNPEHLPAAFSSQFDGVVEVYYSPEARAVVHAHLAHLPPARRGAAGSARVVRAGTPHASVPPGSYAVVVDADGRLADVLFRAAAGAAEARPVFFVQRPVPQAGDLVSLDGGSGAGSLCLARVVRVESGLREAAGGGGARPPALAEEAAEAAAEEGGAEGWEGEARDGAALAGWKPATAQRRPRDRTMSGLVERCEHAHPAEAQGIVHLRVLVEHGLPVRPPRLERIPVCRLRTAFDSELQQFRREHGASS